MCRLHTFFFLFFLNHHASDLCSFIGSSCFFLPSPLLGLFATIIQCLLLTLFSVSVLQRLLWWRKSNIEWNVKITCLLQDYVIWHPHIQSSVHPVLTLFVLLNYSVFVSSVSIETKNETKQKFSCGAVALYAYFPVANSTQETENHTLLAIPWGHCSSGSTWRHKW